MDSIVLPQMTPMLLDAGEPVSVQLNAKYYTDGHIYYSYDDHTGTPTQPELGNWFILPYAEIVKFDVPVYLLNATCENVMIPYTTQSSTILVYDQQAKEAIEECCETTNANNLTNTNSIIDGADLNTVAITDNATTNATNIIANDDDNTTLMIANDDENTEDIVEAIELNTVEITQSTQLLMNQMQFALLGENPYYIINDGSSVYEEHGAVAYQGGVDYTSDVVIVGASNIDTSVNGSYVVTYEVTINGVTRTLARYVMVVDECPSCVGSGDGASTINNGYFVSMDYS